MTSRRVAVLVSGSGRTALNLHAASRDGRMPAQVAAVIAHRDDVPAVARCREAGMRVEIVPGPSCAATSDALDAALRRCGAEMVLLAGYLRMFRVGPWAVHASGARESGCTVHVVDDQYDHGRIVVQRRCPVLPGDTPESLAARVFEQESIAYPDAVTLWSARC